MKSYAEFSIIPPPSKKERKTQDFRANALPVCGRLCGFALAVSHEHQFPLVPEGMSVKACETDCRGRGRADG